MALAFLSSAFCIFVVLLISATTAFADTPAAAGGAGTVVFIPSSFRFADGNTIVTANLHGTVSGTLSGTWSEQAVLVIHPDGSRTTHAFGTFNVTTPCGAGSFAFELEAQQPSATSNLTGNWRSVDQSGNTLTIHTVDTFTTPPNSGTFTYSGTFSC